MAGAPGLAPLGLDPALYLLAGAVVLAVAIIVVLKRRTGKKSTRETADSSNRPAL